MTKRILFVVTVFWVSNAALGIPITIVVTTVNLVFFIHVRPFEDEVVNNFEIFNEIVTSYFLMLLLCLLNTYKISHNIGESSTWMIISVLWVYLMVHISY